MKATISWRELRKRYEDLLEVKGLQGLNMLVAYNYNLQILKELYESSDIDKLFPPDEKILNYRKEKEKRIKELIEKKPSVILNNEKNIGNYIALDLSNPSVGDFIIAFQTEFGPIIDVLKERELAWNKILDEFCNLDIQFWYAPAIEAPIHDQESFMRVSWFLKDLPNLAKDES